MQTITTSDAFAAIEAVMRAARLDAESGWPCLIGGSGIGKTQIVSQYADSIGAELVPIHLISVAPEDLKFPIVDAINETVTFVPAKMFFAGAKPKLFFWDELTHASTTIQALAYQVFEGGRIGDHRLPSDSMHIAAHNRQSDKGVHNRVPMPLRKRWWEMQLIPELGDLTQLDASGLVGTGWLGWANRAGVHPHVLGFLARHGELLNPDIDPRKEELSPDPRSWTKVSKFLEANPDIKPDMLFSLLCGKIGDGPAMEFHAYLRLFAELPDPAAIIRAPKAGKLPTNPSVLYSLTIALSRMMTVANAANIITYYVRMADANFTEITVMGVKSALLRDPSLQAAPAITKWAIDTQHVIC